jgi:hypothetical protein
VIWLAKHTPEVRRWTLAVQKLVRAAVPKTHERIYLGWNVIAFCCNPEMKMNDMFVGISPLKDSVGLYFAHGVDLPDPQGLLEAGKSVKGAKVRSDADVNNPALKKLIQAAYKAVAKRQ